MAAAPTNPLSIAVLALASAVFLVCLGYAVRELRLANHVLRSRPNSVLDAPGGGPIELRGTTEPAGGALRSPFTETPCLAYEYAVEEERNSKHGTTWTTIASGESYVPFRLEDDSGSVYVEPPGADFRLTSEDRIVIEGGTAPPDPIQRFVDREEDVDCQNRTLDLRLFELRTGKDRRFVERRLDVGEEVHVLGTARYDTTVGREAGQVNAAVGIGEAALSDDRWVRLRHRLFGYPFVVSDSSERGLGVRAALYGAGAILGGTTLVVVAVLWVA